MGAEISNISLALPAQICCVFVSVHVCVQSLMKAEIWKNVEIYGFVLFMYVIITVQFGLFYNYHTKRDKKDIILYLHTDYFIYWKQHMYFM